MSKPWNYKAPFLISIPYLIIAAGSIPFDRAMLSILASLITILGIAGFGYFINDLTDIEKDYLIGKENAVAALSNTKRFFLFLFLLSMAIAPWFYFPINWLNASLLFLEFLFFILYSFPPFRLKERGFAGVVTDALYAHANPTLLAAITFLLMVNKVSFDIRNLLIALIVWQFILGIRNIMLHQLKDFENDQQSGTQTFVRKIGLDKAEWWFKHLIVPLEFSSFLFFVVLTNEYVPFFIVAYLLYIPFVFFRVWFLWKRSMPKNIEGILNLFLDNFYVGWIPLLVLGFLSFHSPMFLMLGIVHILLFKNGVSDFFRELKNLNT
ncbi:MAG: UbiA family prenyltransferase [Saprospiraceae bacterium]